jgi:hypothetical protein
MLKAKPRDPRIDFFRGLAIYNIFIDHVFGDPLEKFSYQMIGFSDAAELFVFISGLACGIAYSRRVDSHGFYDLAIAVTKRAVRIYLYYALLSVAMIIMVTTAVKYLELHETFRISTERPLRAIWSALSLTSLPMFVDILVLYIFLTTIVVPLILIARRSCLGCAVAVSGMIWLATQIFSAYMSPLTDRFFFNPFAWQFLFVIGMTFGIRGESPLPGFSLRSRPLVMIAWAIVLGALLYRLATFRHGLNLQWLTLSGLWASKENLSPLRLVHILSMALLVAIHARQDDTIWEWRVVQPITSTGVHSLEVFSLSVILTVVVNIFVLINSPSIAERLVIDAATFLLLLLTATVLTYRRRFGFRQRPRRAAH